MELPRLIPIGTKDWALVDKEDYEQLNAHTWHLDFLNYAVTGKATYMHRLILEPQKGQNIDHRNGNTLDNRRSNLRTCSQQANMANRRKNGRGITTTSRFKGVYFRSDRQRWSSYIGNPRKRERDMLGCYETEEEAALAYNAAARVRFGEFARFNDVPATDEELTEIARSLIARGKLRKIIISG